jgi:small subunit ribosomal protein S3Ae
LQDKIAKLSVDEFVQEATMGKMGADLLAVAKKIAPLRHMGVRKTKLIATPESRALSEAKPIEKPISPSADQSVEKP